MFSRDFDTAVPEYGRAFGGPDFEFLAVRIGFDVGDHEVCEVAEFVREHVEEAVFVVDYFFREFDGGVVSEGGGDWLGIGTWGGGFDGLALPVCASGCGVEFFGPDYLDAAGRGG